MSYIIANNISINDKSFITIINHYKTQHDLQPMLFR